MDKNLDDIIKQIKNNSGEENKNLANQLKNSLNSDEKNALNTLLNDKDKLRAIMETSAVKNILKKFGGESNGSQ